MEVIAGLQAALAVEKLLVDVVQLVKKILRAREDVRSLPTSIEELLKVVEQLDPVIEKIQAKVQDEEGFLKPHLEKLDVELRKASKKVDDVKEKQLKQRPEALEIAGALFKQGAAKQQKEIKAICKAIEREREELDKALTVGTHFKVEDTYVRVESTHLIAENTQLTVQDSASTVQRIESSVKTLHQKVDQFQIVPPPSIIILPPPVIADLDRWAYECLADESHHVDLRIAKSHSNEFFSPGQEYRRQSLAVNDDKDEDRETRRGARVGGWEVENSTKVQFQIQVQEDCFFYVLTFEKGLPNTTNLELIFPEYAVYKNKIVRARKFPDPMKYKTDPPTCKVEKSASLKDGVVGQVLLYIVLSGEPLMQDGSVVVDLNYITEQLSSKDDSEVCYVERFLFDVK